MDSTLPETILNCTQCGGELHPEQGQVFLACPFCRTTVYLDKSLVVFHWYLAPTLDENKARGSLFRWMAGNETVKDLDKKSRISSITFEYFPMWYFKDHIYGNQDRILLVPGAATSISEIQKLNLPAGDLRKFDPIINVHALQPTVPLQSALEWIKQQDGTPATQIVERFLVHIPIFTFKYVYKNASYTALVEGATGSVIANIFPEKAEAPYLVAGIFTAIVFLCLAVIPLAGATMNDAEGAGLGLAICIASAMIAAPVLFALAAWVAAKI